MDISAINLYDTLRPLLGDTQAKAVVQHMDEKVSQKFEESKELLATKQDLSEAKVDIIRWSVALWVAQAALFLGLYLNK